MSTQNTFTVQLPVNILPPRFAMFQNVIHASSFYDGRKLSGTVVGLRYLSPEDAFLEKINNCGWQYTVSFVFGKSPKEAVRNQYEADYFAFEDDLEPVIDCEAA